MSVYSEIVRLRGLRDRIANKLVSLGLLTPQAGQQRTTNDLDACTEAVEDIIEETPYLISTTGIKNVANYKYAQIDQSAWVPAGTIPSGLESHLTWLGATGIMSSRPRNPISIGAVYPNTGSQGMYANALEIDGDVIKAENIKSGVQILGVTGSYTGESTIDYIDTMASNYGSSLLINQLPFNDISKIRYISIILNWVPDVMTNGAILSMHTNGSITYPTTTFRGIKIANITQNMGFEDVFETFLRQDSGGYTLSITPPGGLFFEVDTYLALPLYAVHITYSTV